MSIRFTLAAAAVAAVCLAAPPSFAQGVHSGAIAPTKADNPNNGIPTSAGSNRFNPASTAPSSTRGSTDRMKSGHRDRQSGLTGLEGRGQSLTDVTRTAT